MFEQIQKALTDFLEAFKELPTAKKVAIGGVAAVVMAGLLGVSYLSNRPDYQVLFANLTTEDAAAVTKSLTDANVPYQLAQGGQAVLVPAERVHDLRLQLATEGLPAGGSVGFEIFDGSTFGMTEFVQNLNFRRALQGELERTISQFREVRAARVHIAKPERRLFSKDQEQTKASVVLKLNGRQRLNKEQVMGIVHLVASSIEGMAPENVTVVDVEGHVLSGGEAGDEMTRLSSTQLEYRTTVERDAEKRITSMLESIVGPGKVVTRVSADVDFRRVERTEKKYDPASQVARSEQRSEQSTTGETGPSGVPGIQSNIPGGEQAAVSAGTPAQSSNTQETINYEINETVSHLVEPTGVVRKLSVAVIVDGRYALPEGAAEGAAKEYQPRSAEELTQLRSLVTTAAGIDTQRGDQVTVESAPFDTSAMDELLAEGSASGDLYLSLGEYAGIAALVAVLFIMVIRPMIGWLTATSAELSELRQFPQTVQQMEAQLGIRGAAEETLDYRERIKEIVSQNPGGAAELLREWIRSRR